MTDTFVILHDNGRNEYNSKEKAIASAKRIIERHYEGEHITLYIAEVRAMVTTAPPVNIRVADYDHITVHDYGVVDEDGSPGEEK